MRKFVIFLLLFATLFGKAVLAQTEEKMTLDIDTPLVFVVDSLIQDSLKYEYKKIKELADKSAFTREIYKLIFKGSRSSNLNIITSQHSEARFTPYKGKQIRNIYVKVLPPYGSNINDTTWLEEDLGVLERIANVIHSSTAPSILLKQMTVKPGDYIRPFELVQNEILLSNLSYADEIVFFISEVEDDSSKVDLSIICKDDFSWGIELSTNFSNTAKVFFEDKNFARRGHEFEYGFIYKGNGDYTWGDRLKYRIRNIFKTHWDIRGYYQNDYTAKLWAGDVGKEFLTSATKFAGGAGYARVFRQEVFPEFDIKYSSMLFNYEAVDIWGGRSFLLNEKERSTSNLYLTGRFINTMFKDRPEISPDSNHFYYDRRDFFYSMIYRKVRYYKANLIYDFGRLENIPVGFYGGIIAGIEDNDFKTSTYIGADIKWTTFRMRSERYYGGNLALASYIDGDGFNRGMVKASFRHISNLKKVGKYRVRFFYDANYVKGYKRYPGNHLYFTDDNIIGFDSDTLRGNQKLSLSLGTTLFLPQIKRGFRTAIMGNVDWGILAKEGDPLFRSKSFWGLGLAVNLRNDNLVIKNINIRLTCYLNAPSDINMFYFSISSKYDRGFYDYRVTKPRVIKYD